MTTGGEMLNEIIERLEGVEKQISKLSVELTFREMYATLVTEHDALQEEYRSQGNALAAFMKTGEYQRADLREMFAAFTDLLTRYEEKINRDQGNIADRFPATRDTYCVAARHILQTHKEKYK